MADDRRPADPAAHRPEHEPAPGFDPVHPANDPALERDPAAAPPRGTNTTVVTANSGRGGLYAAAVIAVVAVIGAIVAMNWDWGDPQATIMPADPAAIEQTAPAAEDGAEAPTAADETPAPADGAAEPAPATEPAPAD